MIRLCHWSNRNWLAHCLLRAVIIIASPSVTAQESVPRCRLDDTIGPIVQTAAQWGLSTLAASGSPLKFKRVAINPARTVAFDTLSIFIVKDAGIHGIDRNGCIPLDKKVRVPSGTVSLDGPCVAGNRKRCTLAETTYMWQRMIELASALLDDSRTGYEMAGACYMTNLHACLEHDKHALLKAVGPRDAISVKGTCVTNHQVGTIRCSAGALKLLMSTELTKEKLPTVAMLHVIGHELGHLRARQSSQFDGDEYTLDLQAPSQQKIARISRLCMTGDSLRKAEQEADNTGLEISKHWLPEIRRRSRSGATIPWHVSQSIHFATNLARWNNAWVTGIKVEEARVFDGNPSNQVRELDMEKGTLSGIGMGLNNPRLEATYFVCGLHWARSGYLALDFQSGTLHGTLPERLGPVLTSLRKVEREADSAVSNIEQLVATMADKAFEVEQAHMSRIEGEICSIIDMPEHCTGPAVAEPAVFSSTPRDVNGLHELRLPLHFELRGPYRDTPKPGRALVLHVSSSSKFGSEAEALDEAKAYVKAYSELLGQIENSMEKSGGFWIIPPADDVKVDYNEFSGGYMAHIAMQLVARVGTHFNEGDMLALRKIRKWNTEVYVDLNDWEQARYGMTAYFRPVATTGPARPEIGIATVELPLDKVFDLDASRKELGPRSSTLLNKLLPFLRTRLERNFGGDYSMLSGDDPTFFLQVPRYNLSLPSSWAAIASAKQAEPADSTLSSLIQRAFARGGPNLDVQRVFKDQQ